MTTRIYVVDDQPSKTRRLIEATSAPAAIRHCARNVYTAKAAGPRDIATLMSSGITIERADADTDTTKTETNETTNATN